MTLGQNGGLSKLTRLLLLTGLRYTLVNLLYSRTTIVFLLSHNFNNVYVSLKKGIQLKFLRPYYGGILNYFTLNHFEKHLVLNSWVKEKVVVQFTGMMSTLTKLDNSSTLTGHRFDQGYHRNLL